MAIGIDHILHFLRPHPRRSAFDHSDAPLKRNQNRHLDTPHKDEKKMETQKTNEKTRLMFTLQYSLERYQAMGNGPKCQEIQRELNALKRGTKNA